MITYPKGYSKKTINSFEFIIYPDSAPTNWLNILEDLKVQAYVSPIHDQDIDQDGNLKKPHYHVIVIFGGGKSESFCQGIIDEVGGANKKGEVVRSIEAAIRYLVHFGSMSKHIYNYDDIISFGGAPIKKYFIDSEIEDTSTITEVINYIRSKRNWYFCDFIDYCISNKPSWLAKVRSSWFQSLVKDYMRSLKDSQELEQLHV